MKFVVGVFQSVTQAEPTIDAFLSSGISDEMPMLLSADAPQGKLVPISECEGPTPAKAMGSLVGGALGMGAGFVLGAFAGSAIIPGVTPESAGLITSTLFGVGGALGGFVLAGLLEDCSSEGLPEDEFLIYEDALRRGRSVVIAMASDDAQASAIRHLFSNHGAESVDAAHKQWWVGAHAAQYSAGGSHSNSTRASSRHLGKAAKATGSD
jgi:hypothetical protein